MDRLPHAPEPARNGAAAPCSGCCSRPDNGWVAQAIAQGRAQFDPFRHWLIDPVLPPSLLAAASGGAPVDDACAVASGRREAINAERRFLDRQSVMENPGAAALAEAFENCRTRQKISALCGIDLSGSLLRIEHAADRNGFWLEPHTDIAAKRLTLLIYLSEGPEGEDWGTDLYDGNREPAGRVSARRNSGLMFVPGHDTWHGFERRKITGVRRTLIVNYVDPDWRSRHELVKG
ncbi:2OG-Fe(II) oxygenase [Acetobacteraceae bacterium KSS8]|uniref:2OG-Fe(II) oxygenase n=1 Tax=Endosaccharibacter trunci TaxID=2812733 RepID=A0ABT1W7H1_9PROT|nr:2OG-Fe(II) oxygenase [Acetobacteraceae bacterium KSS8]